MPWQALAVAATIVVSGAVLAAAQMEPGRACPQPRFSLTIR